MTTAMAHMGYELLDASSNRALIKRIGHKRVRQGLRAMDRLEEAEDQQVPEPDYLDSEDPDFNDDIRVVNGWAYITLRDYWTSEAHWLPAIPLELLPSPEQIPEWDADQDDVAFNAAFIHQVAGYKAECLYLAAKACQYANMADAMIEAECLLTEELEAVAARRTERRLPTAFDTLRYHDVRERVHLAS